MCQGKRGEKDTALSRPHEAELLPSANGVLSWIPEVQPLEGGNGVAIFRDQVIGMFF